jgi:hypothetical protein
MYVQPKFLKLLAYNVKSKYLKSFVGQTVYSIENPFFTVRLVTMKSLKLDPMLICFNEFFSPKGYPSLICELSSRTT